MRVGWSGKRKSRGSRSDLSSVGLAALVSRTARSGREGIKKAGGPIWPTALVRPEGGPAACGLARDGHRSPVCSATGRRKASGEERLRHHSEPPPHELDPRPRHASRTGVYPGRGTSVNPDGRRSAGPRRMTCGRAAVRARRAWGIPYRLNRTIGRTGVDPFHWRRSMTLKPARSNIGSVPWKAFAAGTRPAVGVDRVGLEGRRAVASRVVDGSDEEGGGHPLTSNPARDDEADDRPDGRVVDRREHLRIREAPVVLARCQADPTHRPVIAVGDEARREVFLGERLQRGAVAGRRGVGPVAAAEAEERAPAPLRIAAFLEERRQVGELIGGERLDRRALGSRCCGRRLLRAWLPWLRSLRRWHPDHSLPQPSFDRLTRSRPGRTLRRWLSSRPRVAAGRSARSRRNRAPSSS